MSNRFNHFDNNKAKSDSEIIKRNQRVSTFNSLSFDLKNHLQYNRNCSASEGYKEIMVAPNGDSQKQISEIKRLFGSKDNTFTFSVKKKKPEVIETDPIKVEKLIQEYVDRIIMPSALGIAPTCTDENCFFLVQAIWKDKKLDREARKEVVKRLSLFEIPSFIYQNEKGGLYLRINDAICKLTLDTEIEMGIVHKMFMEIFENLNYIAKVSYINLAPIFRGSDIPILEKTISTSRDYRIVRSCASWLRVLYDDCYPQKYDEMNRLLKIAEANIDPDTIPD